MTRLVVPGVDPADQRTSWLILKARLALYYHQREEAEAQAFLAGMCSMCRHQVHGQCATRRACTCREADHPRPPATAVVA